MSDNLEFTILKKQNTELAARIDIYRKLNKELTQKNEDLNTWTVNLASVLSSIEAAFRVFIENEESLYELIKPKGNKEASAVVAKCVNHFKHFNDILSNLPKKIYQNERSNQFAVEAKQGIQSLMLAYDIFFKQFLKSYFAYNQKYDEWISSTLNSPEIKSQIRQVFMREKQNQATIKQFNIRFQQLRSKFPAYQTDNQRTLLSDILKKKVQEIQQINQKNTLLSRRFRLLMDYNPNVVSQTLSESQNYSCICGGVQITYMKQKWQKAQQQRSQQKQTPTDKGMDSEQRKILQNQIQVLVKQNAGYLNRNQQLKIQNNIQQSIFKSHAYNTLVKQAQQLVKYCGILQKKLRDYDQILVQIQKSRQKQLKQLKSKYETSKAPLKSFQTLNTFKPLSKQFTQTISILFKPVLAKIQQNKQWQLKFLKMQKQTRNLIQKMRQDHQSIHKKYDELIKRQQKIGEIQFKHESHKQLVFEVIKYLPKQLLDKFNQYIKNKQKKVQYCQKHIRKLQKQLGAKVTLCESLTTNYQLNQAQFEVMSEKNSELTKSLKNLQDHIKKTVEQNFEIKSQSEKDKSLLELKLKSQMDINSKNLEKINLLEEKIGKYQQYPKQYATYIQNHEECMNNLQERLTASEEECFKLNELLNNKTAKLRQYEKSEKIYTEDNERLRSKLNAIKKTEAKNSQQSNDEERLNYALIQLQDFKSKFICSCQKQRMVEVSLKTCPHVFCRACVEDVQKARIRSCPLCRIKFSKNDVNYMKWT